MSANGGGAVAALSSSSPKRGVTGAGREGVGRAPSSGKSESSDMREVASAVMNVVASVAVAAASAAASLALAAAASMAENENMASGGCAAQFFHRRLLFTP